MSTARVTPAHATPAQVTPAHATPGAVPTTGSPEGNEQPPRGSGSSHTAAPDTCSLLTEPAGRVLCEAAAARVRAAVGGGRAAQGPGPQSQLLRTSLRHS